MAIVEALEALPGPLALSKADEGRRIVTGDRARCDPPVRHIASPDEIGG